MGRNSALFKLYSQVDFEEIRQNGTTEAKEVIDLLIKTGLGYFLDGPHVIYKEAVEEFFKTATISYDRIIATGCGSQIEITEAVVAESLRLPTTGEDATAPIDDDTFETARHLLSATNKPITTSGKDEEWASEETDTEWTEDRTVHEDDNSARSPNDAERSANPETTEGEDGVDEGDNDEGDNDEGNNQEEADEAEAERLAQNIFQGINRRDEDVIDLYLEWHEYRFNTKYKDIRPDLSQQVEYPTPSREEVETPREFEEPILEDEEPIPTLGVEVPNLEDAVPNLESEVPSLKDAATLEPPNENAALIDSGERGDPDPTEQLTPTPPPEATVSVPPKEWIDDRLQEFEASVSGRIDDQLKKFEMSISGQLEDRLQKFKASISEQIDDRVLEHEVSKLQPFKECCNKIFDSAMQFAGVTKNLVDQHQARLADLSTGLWEEAGEREKCAQHTAALEGITSDLKKDFERVDTTIDRVSVLEKTNETLVAEENADAAALEADALIAKRVQDELNAEASKDKEAPRSSQLTEAEIEAERIRRAEILYPGYAEKVASQAAADAERLDTEARRLAGFAKEHEKKKKAAASDSEPKKRKRPAPKKVRIVEMLNEISDPVATGDENNGKLADESDRKVVEESEEETIKIDRNNSDKVEVIECATHKQISSYAKVQSLIVKPRAKQVRMRRKYNRWNSRNANWVLRNANWVLRNANWDSKTEYSDASLFVIL
ncbi:uncharacterized protein LOC124926073 [Impatiens glandulifera]|uniref:uncharacterized protein LOC124926073 n=1 Tax=Impatiens glandulifera TaxID=253017 RepID=UPI001FB0F06B|nr:uncharacterized protein LOC124926073 [Impatiens glandulifera]